jgi:hypothetical protein
VIQKQIGKIEIAYVGTGGYQDAMFGITFRISGKGWGVSDFWGTWSRDPDKHCKWTIEEQTEIWGDVMRRIAKLLVEAKVTDVEDLRGKPVEVTFEDGRLKSWRILDEVL